jgi:hypothetical protein
MVQERMDFLSKRLALSNKEDRVVAIQWMWSAFACDVVTEYAFGFHYDQCGSEGFADNFHEPFLAVSEFGHIALQFPWMATVLLYTNVDL